MKKTLLSLDMSTTCTGWALFDIESKELLAYDKLKPSVKGGSKMTYPRAQLERMKSIAEQILGLVESYKPHGIVIEEITGSKQRLGQKTLDGLHFIVAYYLQEYLDIVSYYDVTGLNGWRTHLNLRLSDADKASNKESKKLNKKLPPRQKLPIIGPKHLACRHANRRFGMNLDVEVTKTDADIADALCLGDAFLKFRFTELIF